MGHLKFENTMFMIILLFVLSLNSGECRAQKNSDDISIGKHHSIYSNVLNEERNIMIHLPADYKMSTLKYPVIYILDGDLEAIFARITGTLDFLAYNGQIPPMIIISIANTDRGRDMFPLKVDRVPGSGGADNFQRFISEELIPYIDDNYRTANNKILYGESNSALFSIYTLLTRPKLFNSIIAVSPTIGWCPDLISNKATSFMENSGSLNAFLFMIYGENDFPLVTSTVPQLSSQLEKQKPAGFGSETRIIPNEGHVPDAGIKIGLTAIFSDLNIPREKLIEGLESVIDFYKIQSKKYGFEIIPPEQVLFNLAGPLFAQRKLEDAEKLMKYLVESHPSSADGYFYLGDVTEKLGKTNEAAKYYKKVLELNPHYSKAKARLENLTRK